MAMDSSQRTFRFLSADILTSGYRVVGKFAVSAQGAMGIMNDPTHSALDVTDAKLARLHMPSKLVDHFEVIRMMKDRMHLVCMPRREDLGPQSVVRGGYSKAVEYPVRITTQMFEVEGILEMPGRFDFTALMKDGTRDFLPVFNATVTAILIPTLRIESAGVLINRKQIDIVALLNQRVKPEK